MINSVFMLSRINDDYDDDRPFQISFYIILATSSYIAVVSLALELIIMLLLMIVI